MAKTRKPQAEMERGASPVVNYMGHCKDEKGNLHVKHTWKDMALRQAHGRQAHGRQAHGRQR